MATRLIITDLTRMSGGHVCLAGYDIASGRCLRPVLRWGNFEESWLYRGPGGIIKPFALVDLDFLLPLPDPPHTEDTLFDPDSILVVGAWKESARHHWLIQSTDRCVDGIFGAPVCEGPGWYVEHGLGTRSLGTIRAGVIGEVIYKPKDGGGWDYRLRFLDLGGRQYRLAVVDLAFRYYLDYQRLRNGEAPAAIAERLTNSLQRAEVYLRIGLARGWKEYPERCYLQVTGVYSFPDYLGGRCFADFFL